MIIDLNRKHAVLTLVILGIAIGTGYLYFNFLPEKDLIVGAIFGVSAAVVINILTEETTTPTSRNIPILTTILGILLLLYFLA